MNLENEKVRLKDFCGIFRNIPIRSRLLDEIKKDPMGLVILDYFSKYSKKEMEEMPDLLYECIYNEQILLIHEILNKDACYEQFSKVGKWFIDFSKKYEVKNELAFSYMMKTSESRKREPKEDIAVILDCFNSYVYNKGGFKEELIDEILKDFSDVIPLMKKEMFSTYVDADLYVRACERAGVDILSGVLDSYLPSEEKNGNDFFISSTEVSLIKRIGDLGGTFTGDNYSYRNKSLIECFIQSGRSDLINLIPYVKTIKAKDPDWQEKQNSNVDQLPDKFNDIKAFYRYMETKDLVEIETKQNAKRIKV